MLIVENRGFYLSHSITELFEDQVLNPDTANQLIKKLQSELKEYYKVSFEKYWFDKYQEKSKYIKFIVSTVEDLYIKKYSIKSFIIKFYHDGFATIESYIERNFDFANDIDTAIEDFQIDFKDKLYELVIEVSKVLEENKIIEFSKGYKYGFPSIKVDEKNYVQFNNKQDYFLQRTHFFIDSSKFDKIRRGFNDQKINFSEAVLSPYNLLILWAYCFWNKDVYSLDKDINSISSLLDIDSYTLNESSIYNKISNIYTELLYKIKFLDNKIYKSKYLSEAYRLNNYFLQKNKLFHSSFENSVENFVFHQKTIENFDQQKADYNDAESKFIFMLNALRAKEKSNSDKTIQYVLTFLTLFTIISVSNDTLQLSNANFLDNHGISIEIMSRLEIVSLIVFAIFLAFFFLKRKIDDIY